jgi:hypothetical protein
VSTRSTRLRPSLLSANLTVPFQAQIELVRIELFRAPAELHSLQLAKQMTQPVVLARELIALFAISRPFSARSASRSAHAVSTRARSAARSSGMIHTQEEGSLAQCIGNYIAKGELILCLSDGWDPFWIGVVIAEVHAEEDLGDDAPTDRAELWGGDCSRRGDGDADRRFVPAASARM